MPKWATPERKARLVELFHKSGGFCVFGDDPCPHPYDHHYVPFVEGLIKEFIADDRADDAVLWRLERERMHRVPDAIFRQGRFDTVARAEFLANQPACYLQGLSIDPLTFLPTAKVRIPSTFSVLFVDVSDAFKGLSKSARRRAIRRGGISPQVQDAIIRLAHRAVADWWAA